jgi:hypothetical protein
MNRFKSACAWGLERTAMFTNPDAHGIVLQGANHPFEYKCKRGRMGQIQRSSGVVLTNEQLMAVRILGTVH